METQSLAERHVQESIKKILKNSNSILASSTGLVEVMHTVAEASQQATGKGKGTPAR